MRLAISILCFASAACSAANVDVSNAPAPSDQDIWARYASGWTSWASRAPDALHRLARERLASETPRDPSGLVASSADGRWIVLARSEEAIVLDGTGKPRARVALGEHGVRIAHFIGDTGEVAIEGTDDGGFTTSEIVDAAEARVVANGGAISKRDDVAATLAYFGQTPVANEHHLWSARRRTELPVPPGAVFEDPPMDPPPPSDAAPPRVRALVRAHLCQLGDLDAMIFPRELCSK